MNKELLEYFDGDELAASVWKDKYALEGETTPEDMHQRMAEEFARIEMKYPKVSDRRKNLSKYYNEREPLTKEKILSLFRNFKYIIPQGSIMSMLGNPTIGSLSNCFVIDRPHDSYGGILKTDQEMAQLMKRRGGVGVDISSLRPKGVPTKNAAKTSTGAASFMHRYSNTTREVAQAGRRGALMLTLDVRHPDVSEFINAKQDRTKVTGANISVILRDDFMNAVENDEDYVLTFPCDFNRDHLDYLPWQEYEYNELVKEVNNHTGKEVYIKKVRAKELYDQIVHNAWDNAEPGQMFGDTHLKRSPDGVYEIYQFLSTNPCGEIGMAANDACRLLAMNFFFMVKNPYQDNPVLDLDLVYRTAYEQQRLADDIVDLELEHIRRIMEKIENDPEPEDVKTIELELWRKIYTMTKASRRTGCGFTGLGDMLAAMGVVYGSGESKHIVDQVMRAKMEGELDATVDMAIERGTFKGWKRTFEYYMESDRHGTDMYVPANSFFKTIREEFPSIMKRMCKYGRRNISWSTVAPTGSVSILTQTTSGIEPLFKPFYKRRKKVNPDNEDVRVDYTDQNGDNWQEYFVLHKRFADWLLSRVDSPKVKREGVGYAKKYTIEDLQQMGEEKLNMLYEHSPWYGSSADEINWEDRLVIQAIVQDYTTHSISSTLNLPKDTTEEEVSEIYKQAHDLGLKGVTIYRDGCRSGVLVSSNEGSGELFPQYDAPDRPKSLPVDVHHLMADGNRWTVLVGLLDDKPYEVFALEGTIFSKYDKGMVIKEGNGKYSFASEEGDSPIKEDITKDMTVHHEDLTRSWSGSLRHGMSVQYLVEQLQKNRKEITSFSKAVARTLVKYVPESDLLDRAKCSECGSANIRMTEGCMVCNDCGSSKCG